MESRARSRVLPPARTTRPRRHRVRHKSRLNAAKQPSNLTVAFMPSLLGVLATRLMTWYGIACTTAPTMANGAPTMTFATDHTKLMGVLSKCSTECGRGGRVPHRLGRCQLLGQLLAFGQRHFLR